MRLKLKFDSSDVVIRAFFGWHDLIAKLPDSERYGIVGRGSIRALRTISYYENIADKVENHLFTIGRYCETADCKIVLAGEHDNSHPINVVFGDMPGFVAALRQHQRDIFSAEFPGFFRIGNGVVIGHQAVLLGGIDVGDGVVIGAGAVVPKSIPPWSVVVGNPPKVRPRVIEVENGTVFQNWWDYSIDDMKRIVVGDFSKIERPRKPVGQEPYVVVSLKKDGAGKLIISEILGFQCKGQYVSYGSAPQVIREYFMQIKDACDGKAVDLDSNILDYLRA